MHCGWRYRQQLYATAGDSVLPAVFWLSQRLTFFLVFFNSHFSTEKRKENENADVFFGRKIKRRKIKMRFLAPKNKKKTKFGRPLITMLIVHNIF